MRVWFQLRFCSAPSAGQAIPLFFIIGSRYQADADLFVSDGPKCVPYSGRSSTSVSHTPESDAVLEMLQG